MSDPIPSRPHVDAISLDGCTAEAHHSGVVVIKTSTGHPVI